MRRFRFYSSWQAPGVALYLTVSVVTSVAFVVHPPALPRLSSSSSSTGLDSVNNYIHLDHIDRVLCISDLHTDHADNMQWLANHTNSDSPVTLNSQDLIVVAGDISHDMDRIEQSLMYLLRTGASVMFVAGNHEAWLHSKELEEQSSATLTSPFTSMDKLSQVYQTCHELGVYTQTCLNVGGTSERPHTLWLVPLESWYDGSLSIMECEDLCHDFGKWPWVDFLKCQWPGFPSLQAPNSKIPQGLSHYFASLNEPLLKQLSDWIKKKKKNNYNHDTQSGKAVLTISHFLPNQQCLPDWKDVDSPVFRRDLWLHHGGGGISAKFAKVAGTNLLDQQIRSLDVPSSTRRLHIFGHSHRPKDFEWKGIRYIHNPLGKPREREIHMVSPQVDFQEVWNTKTGEVPGEQVIRYWEEKGGGLEALLLRMSMSKKKNRYGKVLKTKTQSNQSN